MSTERVHDHHRTVHQRAYQAPVLVKGPVLITVTAAKSVSGTIPTCWVARAAFGESDIRWMIFREWLVVEAPAWFRALYIRHGEAVGAWLQNRPLPRAAVRGLMTKAIRRVAKI